MKKMKRILVLGLATCITVLGLGISPKVTEAASKTGFSKKSVSIKVGKKKTIKFKLSKKDAKKKVTYSSSKKSILKVKKRSKKKVQIIGKKAGTAKLRAKVGKKTYTMKVKVKAASSSSSTSASNPSSKNATVDTSSASKTSTGEYASDKLHTGDATFYTRTSTGCANLDEYESIYYTCAMNSIDYAKGLAGAYLEVTDKDGDVVYVMVTDELPEGKEGDIDLSPQAFASIEDPVTGRMKVTWRVIALPTEDPVSFRFKPTSSQYWAEVQVRNHRYPISKLEVLVNGSYMELTRKNYNYFAAPNGMGTGPFTFRITDLYGDVIVEKNIPLKTSEMVTGTGNFPLRK